MGEANRREAFEKGQAMQGPPQRYNIKVKRFSAPETEFAGFLQVGLDKEGRMLIVADDATTHVFPIGVIEYYSFTKI